MLTFDQLDFIADLYIPVLVLISLYFLVKMFCLKFIFKALVQTALMGGAVVFIYCLMFVDRYFLIWESLGLDYSTHTALALVFIVFLALKGFRLMLFVLLSMLLYAGLMVYQDYHSVLDIVSTGMAVTPVLMWLFTRSGSCGQTAG